MNKLKFQLIFIIFFSLLGICANILLLVNTGSLLPIAFLLMYLAVGLYIVYDYKTPHGNLFKTSLLSFSSMILIPLVVNSGLDIIINAALAVASVFVAYFAGRLHRIEKNQISIVTVLAALFIAGAMYAAIYSGNETGFKGLLERLELFNYMILFTDLTFAYYARFDEHIASGIKEDKKEK